MKINSQHFTPMMKNGNGKTVKSESIFMADSFSKTEGQKSGEFFDPKCIGAANQKAGGNCDLGPCMGGAEEKAGRDLGPCVGGAKEKAGDAMEWNYCFGGGNEKAAGDVGLAWCLGGATEEKASAEKKFDVGNISL